jgi:hypothetical protein
MAIRDPVAQPRLEILGVGTTGLVDADLPAMMPGDDARR